MGPFGANCVFDGICLWSCRVTQRLKPCRTRCRRILHDPRQRSSIFGFGFSSIAKALEMSTFITKAMRPTMQHVNERLHGHSAAQYSRTSCSSWWTDTRRPVSSSKLAIHLGRLRVGNTSPCAMPGLNAAAIQRPQSRSVESLRRGVIRLCMREASMVARQPRLQARY
jgi:hypothetical protein